MNIEQTAQALAVARAQLIEAEAHQSAATQRVSAITTKIQEATNAQGHITRRRVSGEHTAKDAAEFAALSADLELLRGMLAEAKAAIKESSTTAQLAIVAEAEQQHERAIRLGEFEALQAKATEIDALLCRCVGELHALGCSVFSHISLSMNWRPSDALKSAITDGRAPSIGG